MSGAKPTTPTSPVDDAHKIPLSFAVDMSPSAPLAPFAWVRRAPRREASTRGAQVTQEMAVKEERYKRLARRGYEPGFEHDEDDGGGSRQGELMASEPRGCDSFSSSPPLSTAQNALNYVEQGRRSLIAFQVSSCNGTCKILSVW